jgi:hypothetical protein
MLASIIKDVIKMLSVIRIEDIISIMENLEIDDMSEGR